MTTYGVVRLDKVRSVYSGHLESLVYDDGALQNGYVAMYEGLREGERELRDAIQPVTAKLHRPVVLIAAPEVRYEEYIKELNALEWFRTPAGYPVRAYHLEKGDIFSVSDTVMNLIGDEPEIGNYALAEDGSFELREYETGTDASGYGFVGRIIDYETIGTTVRAGGPSPSGAGFDVGRTINFVVIDVIRNDIVII